MWLAGYVADWLSGWLVVRVAGLLCDGHLYIYVIG